jgi:hypothetical protein
VAEGKRTLRKVITEIGRSLTNSPGILERILIRRFGDPVGFIKRGLPARGWNPDEWDYDSALYTGMKWNSLPGLLYGSLEDIYGDSIGGYLIKNTLKAAILTPGDIYGIWNIADLRVQPAVQRALVLDPAVDYFMEEHNRNFYGVKRGQLIAYDAEYDDVELLGPVEAALEEVFNEWADICLNGD